MPELPEAEYMVRRLAEYAAGARIRRARVLRQSIIQPQSARYVTGHARGRIAGFGRRAKNVLFHLDTGWSLRVQLGMTGHIYWIPASTELPRFTRAVLDLEDGAAIAFEDSRTFGRIHAHPTAELSGVLAGYGPEPLDDTFRWQELRRAAKGLSLPLKPFLLDQSRVAGLGNIWAAEALYGAALHPARSVRDLADGDWRRLHAAIRRTLSRAIENAFKVTEGPEEFPEADLQRLSVYGRAGQPCRRCQGPVARTVQAARATYFCPRCQR